MPERRTQAIPKRRDENGRLGRHAGRSRLSVRGLTGAEAAQRARRELAEITGLMPEHVTSLERSDGDTWTVTVELLELSRVPDTYDVIGSYEAELDDTGELLAYRRARRYSRCETQAQRGGALNAGTDGDDAG